MAEGGLSPEELEKAAAMVDKAAEEAGKPTPEGENPKTRDQELDDTLDTALRIARGGLEGKGRKSESDIMSEILEQKRQKSNDD